MCVCVCVCVCPACYLRITCRIFILVEYVGYLYQILICKKMFKWKAFFVFIFQLQLQKVNNAHNKMYKKSWKIAFQMHHHVQDA